LLKFVCLIQKVRIFRQNIGGHDKHTTYRCLVTWLMGFLIFNSLFVVCSLFNAAESSSGCVTRRVRLLYFYGSMHRWSILITVQPDVTQSSLFIILQIHSTCFGCQTHPSNCSYSLRYWSYFLCTYLPPTWPSWPCWLEVAAQKILPVPEAVVTVSCIPDDGCGWHPKHVNWTCRIINRLFCDASRWTIISIEG